MILPARIVSVFVRGDEYFQVKQGDTVILSSDGQNFCATYRDAETLQLSITESAAKELHTECSVCESL